MKRALIIAFGSRISGKATSKSDFDFAVLKVGPLTLEERTDMAEYLARKFSINEDCIDLVDLFNASPILKFEVARVGRLMEGDTFDFIRFKVRAFKEYQNTLKFRLLRKRVMLHSNV